MELDYSVSSGPFLNFEIEIFNTLSKTFFNSSLQFWNSSFYTSKVRKSLPTLGMQCQNYLLIEVGICSQFQKSISDFSF